MALPKKKALLEAVGRRFSFLNNFNASAKGWKTPKTPTLPGPLRSWEALKNFRSSRVKKATERRARRKVKLNSRVDIKLNPQ